MKPTELFKKAGGLRKANIGGMNLIKVYYMHACKKSQ
jgi:hypothetical protein